MNAEIIPIDWIVPLKGERLEGYALRLADKIDTTQKFGLIGVSFGGLVSVEISKKLNPELVILISSVETKKDLPFIYRLTGKLRFMRILPKMFFNPPKKFASWLFGAKNKTLLNEILKDTDLNFAKWAVNQLTQWKNKEKLKCNVIKISGTKDKLIPPNNSEKEHLINGGQHFMIVDRADEVSDIINNYL